MRDWFGEIQYFQLPNGMPVVHLHMPERPQQFMGFILRAGTYHTRDIPGLAHFAEHIVANSAGCVKLNKNLWEKGGHLLGGGGSTGALTSRYGFGLLADSPELESLARYHIDYIFKNSLSHDIEGEKGPFAAEFNKAFPTRRRLTVPHVVHASLCSGDWETPTLGFGTEQGISPFTRQDVEAFYREYYHPGNVSHILSVGPLNRPALEQLLERSGWSGLARERSANPVYLPSFTGHAPRLNQIASYDPEATSCDSTHITVFPLAIPLHVVNVTRTIFAEHLQEKLRENARLIYNLKVQSPLNCNHHRFFVSCAGIAASRSQEFWDAYRSAMDSLVSGEAITDSLVERAKKIQEIGFRTEDLTAERIYSIAERRLMSGLPLVSAQENIEGYRSVSTQQVRQLAATMSWENSFIALDLAPGAAVPSGLPHYDLFDVRAALAEGRAPRVLAPSSLEVSH